MNVPTMTAAVALATLAGAASAQQLVPTVDNRAGNVSADCNARNTFPDPVESGYNTDPSEMYNLRTAQVFNVVANSCGANPAARNARSGFTTSSRFAGINASESRITGVRFDTTAFGNQVLFAGQGSDPVSVIVSENLDMGFRLEGLPAGGVHRMRLVGAVGPATGATGTAETAQVRVVRGATNLATFGPNSTFNQILSLTQNGEYALRGTYSINEQLSTPDSTGAGASMRAALVCVADFDGSGLIEVSDIFNYLSAWFANNAVQADVDGNGGVTVNDIFAFLSVWFTGCQA